MTKPTSKLEACAKAVCSANESDWETLPESWGSAGPQMTREQTITQAVRNVCAKNGFPPWALGGFIDWATDRPFATLGYSWLWAIREEFKRLAAREAASAERPKSRRLKEHLEP